MDPMEAMSAGPQVVPTNFNAEEAGNLEDMEKQWSVKVVMLMQIYWGLLENQRGSTLSLTGTNGIDEEIYEHFKQEFPDFDPAEPIDEDKMKSPEGKKRWEKFISAYKDKVPDHNLGFIVRKNPKDEFTQDGSIFAVYMQHVAIEIARNKAGLNDWVYEQAQKEAKQASS